MAEPSYETSVAGHEGVPIAVQVHPGPQPALVLLHGAARNLADWQPMLERLRPVHHVVCVDLRGHGRSGSGPWRFPAAVADVRSVLTELELTKPVVVGHSLGGMLAALLAADPDLLAAAVNLDGHGPGRPNEYPGLDPERVAERLAEARQMGPASLPGPHLTATETRELVETIRSGARAVGMDPEHATAVWERSLVATDDGGADVRPRPDVLGEVLDDVAALDLVRAYQRAAVPLLIARATRVTDTDGWIADLHRARTTWLTAALADVSANNPLVEVVDLDTDHGLIGTAPDLASDVVLDFVRRRASADTA